MQINLINELALVLAAVKAIAQFFKNPLGMAPNGFPLVESTHGDLIDRRTKGVVIRFGDTDLAVCFLNTRTFSGLLSEIRKGVCVVIRIS